MEALFFYLFGGLALISSVLVVFLKKPVHNAVALIFTFFCLAGLYLILGAEFVAIIQVLVYAGAIMVLFLFVIMLLNLEEEEAIEGRGNRFRRWLGGICGGVGVPASGSCLGSADASCCKGDLPPREGTGAWQHRLGGEASFHGLSSAL